MLDSYLGRYVGIKHWARKDYTGSREFRNLYKVIRETEKAVYLCPVDKPYGAEFDFCFWCAKSAITHYSEKNGYGINWC